MGAVAFFRQCRWYVVYLVFGVVTLILELAAREVVSKLLVTSPRARLQASEVLKHPWLARMRAGPEGSTTVRRN